MNRHLDFIAYKNITQRGLIIKETFRNDGLRVMLLGLLFDIIFFCRQVGQV
jgi:hypothetical protein